jgi:hypothetical protein
MERADIDLARQQQKFVPNSPDNGGRKGQFEYISAFYGSLVLAARY